MVCCYNKYLEDTAYDDVVREKIEPCRIAQLNARENIEAVNRMLDEECGIFEETFHAVRCVEGMFQGEKFIAKAAFERWTKTGFSLAFVKYFLWYLFGYSSSFIRSPSGELGRKLSASRLVCPPQPMLLLPMFLNLSFSGPFQQSFSKFRAVDPVSVCLQVPM